MRSITKCLLATGAAFAMVAGPAGAAETQDELREMRELVLQLQDRLEAQQDQIDEQQVVIKEAGLEEERGSESALSSFLESTDFSGWVAASYFWNFNNPRNPQNGGNAAISNPFHQDHNSFQFDEAWFVMSRSPTEESPAGFEFEVTYGATATALAPPLLTVPREPLTVSASAVAVAVRAATRTATRSGSSRRTCPT